MDLEGEPFICNPCLWQILSGEKEKRKRNDYGKSLEAGNYE